MQNFRNYSNTARLPSNSAESLSVILKCLQTQGLANCFHGVSRLIRVIYRAAGLGVIAAAVLTWASCGGGSSNNPNVKPISHVQNRLFVGNAYSGYVQIVDATTDVFAGAVPGQVSHASQYDIFINGSPQFFSSTPDNVNIAMYDAAFTSIAVVNSNSETRIAKTTLDNWTESIAISSDAKFVYAAIRNHINGSGKPLGAVVVMDVAGNGLKAYYAVPNVRWIGLDNAGKHLIAIPDSTVDPAYANTAYYIDLTATTPTAVQIPGLTLDRPVAAFFSSDDTKAYILSCGAECGGTQAMVTEVTVPGFVSRNVNVPAATVGAINGTNVYVAGSPGGSGGAVTAIDTGAMAVTDSQPIGSGTHGVLKFLANKVWIGAHTCGGTGCLSMYDPAAKVAVVDQPIGDVTGLDYDQPNNQVYVCEGNELRRYDTNMTPVFTQVDIIGQAYDVRAVPPSTQ